MALNSEIRSTRRFPFLRNFPASLQRAHDQDPIRVLGQVVGTVNADRFIVCGVEAGAFDPGDILIVRMAVGNEVLGFLTHVLEVISAGTPMYLLATPDKVESLNLRKAERLSLFIPAEVQFSNREPDTKAMTALALLQGMMVNLSKDGCCLSTKRPLSLEQTVRLAFTLPGGRHVFRLGGKVRRHLDNPRPGVFVQGVQFDRQTEQLPALADLNQWITQNLPFALPS